jgi:ArsR family transcriptional regulator
LFQACRLLTITSYHHRVVISAKRDAFEVMALLADPVRAQIVQALAGGPACVCHLVEDLNLKQPNISNHIRVLRQAGLIRGENRGRFTFYRLDADAVDAAADQLARLAEAARSNATTDRECS